MIENIFHHSTPTAPIHARVLSMREPSGREAHRPLISVKTRGTAGRPQMRRALLRGRGVSHCGRALSTMMDIPQIALPLLLR